MNPEAPLVLLTPPPPVRADQVLDVVERACPRARALAPGGEGELRFELPPDDLVAAVRGLRALHVRLLTHVAVAEAGGVRLVVSLAPHPGTLVVSLETVVAEGGRLISLTGPLPGAARCEAEAAARFGLTFTPGSGAIDVAAARAAALPELVHGPIADALAPTAALRLRVDGEAVRAVSVDLGFEHRGAEQLCEGRMPDAVLPVIERVCARCAVAHAVACAEAVERAAGAVAAVPARAAALRVLLAELERMRVHTADLVAVLEAAALHAGATRLRGVLEELHEVCEQVSGSRWLFGAVAVGGVTRDLPAGAATRDLARQLRRFARRLGALWDRSGDTAAALDRSEGLGVVARSRALSAGMVGVVARACRIPRDVRRDRPYAFYPSVDFKLALDGRCDVAARARVRLEEIKEAVAIACQVIEGLPEGPYRAEVPAPAPGRVAHGWAESAQGETVVWLRVGAGGRIERLRVRAASLFNWAALGAALPGVAGVRGAGAGVADVPIVRASLGLCVPCVDR